MHINLYVMNCLVIKYAVLKPVGCTSYGHLIGPLYLLSYLILVYSLLVVLFRILDSTEIRGMIRIPVLYCHSGAFRHRYSL